MLALYNFVPKYCAVCGTETGLHKDRGLYWDYQMRASMTCKCGLHFQRAKTTEMVIAAHNSEGDLPTEEENPQHEKHIMPTEKSTEELASKRRQKGQ